MGNLFFSKKTDVKKIVETNTNLFNDEINIINDFDNLHKLMVTKKTCMECNTILENIYYFTLRKCDHVFCSKCLVTYIKETLAPKIKCPLATCSVNISDFMIRQCLPDPLIEEYERRCQDLIGVKCAISECLYFYKPDSEDGYFNCPECEQPNCLKCQSTHLYGEPCGESLDKAKFEEMGLKKIQARRNNKLRHLEKNSTIILNPESSDCDICCSFLIPRQGILIRGCCHNSCRDCLESHLKSIHNIKLLKCPSCDEPLQDREYRELLGDDATDCLTMRPVENKFFNCQSSDCFGCWDPGEFTGEYECPRCKEKNCIACRAIHDGMTCSQYKDSPVYMKLQKSMKMLKIMKGIDCYSCQNTIFIREGGCGALQCNYCLNHVCQFTGLKCGPDGCKCTADKPCHVDCTRGCYPD